MPVQNVNDPGKSAKPDADPKADTEIKDEPYLGTWQTKEAAEEGLANLTGKMDAQGNEVGTLRKQVDFFQKQFEGTQQQPAKAEPEAPKGPDYGAEMKAVQTEMSKLDADDPGYQKDLGKLVIKSNQIAAKQATQAALEAAQAEFTKVLDERDVQSMHKSFYRDNPDFNTPEMQMRIQEYLANDQTGMSDPMVAYREIQRDDIAARATELEEENAEIKRLLDLKKGEEATGKVVTKGQSPQQKIKQPKATGAALDQGMRDVLANL